MRTRLFLFFIGLIAMRPTIACDICACGIGGNFSGITPNYSKNTLGFKYQNQKSNLIDNPLNYNGLSQVESDTYHKTDFYYRYFPSKRVQLLFVAPFQLNTRTESLRSSSIQGIGDISTSAYYIIVNTGDSMMIKNKHTWSLGGGVKLPTGKYQQRDESKALLPYLFQIGTGAFGVSGRSIYTYRRNNFGINADVLFQHNFENERGYQLGNQLSSSLGVFYLFKGIQWSCLPAVGLGFDHLSNTTLYDVNNPYIGGNSVSAQVNFDVFYRRIRLQTSFSKIIQQNLSVSMPQNSLQFGFGLAYYME